MPATLTQQDIEKSRGTFPPYSDPILSAGHGGALPNDADAGMLGLVDAPLDRPVSGSLQHLSRAGRPPFFEDHYSARSRRGTSGPSTIPRVLPGETSMRPVGEIGREIGILNAPVLPRTATARVVASFVGRVESMSGAAARVLLMNERTGERMESRCDAEVLQENGIAGGDEFRFEVLRSRGATTTRFSKLDPKPVSKEKLDEIRAAYEDRWSF
jgi:hypothetical protein